MFRNKLNMNKFILGISVFISLAFSFTACTNEKLGESMFDLNAGQLDSTSYTYNFDKYLEKVYLKPYNLQFVYKLKDVATDVDYNLVPASFENAKKLAVLTKYLWFDVYAKVVDTTFIKQYGPRMIHIIGSPAYNPSTGTMLLGLAEGGIKISLYRVNNIDVNDVNVLNEYYFKTMHHEFAHILHQTKSYPVEFNLISYKNYDPYSWQQRTDEEAASLGFASPYGSSQTREDFVEIIANYIVKTDTQWNHLLDIASKGWTVNAVTGAVRDTTDTDGVDGKATILKKLSICREWLKSDWYVNLDTLRAEVQLRQKNINIVSLLSEIDKK
jgi:substrate import-associated zinc metallohydrolase lipoprotein